MRSKAELNRLRASDSLVSAGDDLGTAYEKLTPILLRALGALARNGFALPPTDALDFIHDFFIDVWPTVSSHFDPNKGSLENYVYVAFVHFARPRIVRLKRLQNALVDPMLLETVEIPHRARPDIGFWLDYKNWTDAIASLPGRDRQLLSAYLHEGGGSERYLAKKTGLSRYAIREELICILGRLTALFGRPPDVGHDDWKVAEAIWLDGRSIHETATLLATTIEAVRRAKARNARVIVEALRRFESKDGKVDVGSAQASKGETMNPESLLHKVLMSPGDTTLLREVRERSVEVLAALDRQDLVLPARPEPVDALWIAEVYEALAGSAAVPASAETIALERELFSASEADLASIGTAFKETLLPDLPIELTKFGTWFKSVERPPEEVVSELTAYPDVIAAFPNSAELILYGIRPSTFFFATEAVSALLDRLIRSGVQQPVAGFTLRMGTPLVVRTRDEEFVVRVEDDIEKMADCSSEAAGALLPWLLKAAEYKPFLFSGFETEPRSNGVSLKQSPEKFVSLQRRWGVAYAID